MIIHYFSDLHNKLSAELIGLSDIIPAYCVSDFIEVLELINRDFKVKLETTRPTKVLYFLQVRHVIPLVFLILLDMESNSNDLNSNHT